ncbi:MAG: hypothetical protein CMH52_12290 [Myxococcales bacterium]|nr:hypothetical protein [Myxococcales bacterium]
MRAHSSKLSIIFVFFILGCLDESPAEGVITLFDAMPSIHTMDGDASLVPPDAGPSDLGDSVHFDDIEITAGRSEFIRVNIPPNTLSLHIDAVGDPSVVYAISHLESEDGDVLVSEMPDGVTITNQDRQLSPFPGPFKSPNRSASPNTGVATLLAPNNLNVNFYPGPWLIRVSAMGAFGAINTTTNLRVTYKRARDPQINGRIPLHFFFTGANGWTAQSAANDPTFQAAVNRMASFYAAIGIELTSFTFDDIPSSYRQVDIGPLGPGRPDSSLHAMFSLNTYETGVALFFVDRIGMGQNGGIVGGISGGTPGPLRPGTVRSGVAVATLLSSSPGELGHVMAHETGHYLGLFHTQETVGGIVDQLNDTPTGFFSSDNLMFPTVTSAPASLSDEQAWVIYRNPVVEGGVDD